MSTPTIALPAILPDVTVVPELDLATGDEMGDELLLASVAATTPKKVRGTRSALQSHTARAWSAGGHVD